MIRILVVDDHPAMRTGLGSVLRREPGMVVCGLVADGPAALDVLAREPDVALLDYHLGDEDGIGLGSRLKELKPGLRVLVYSAHASRGLALPARLSGADGVLDKGAPADELLTAIRDVYHGRAVFPRAALELARTPTTRVPEDDLPLLGMLADGATRSEVSTVMRITRDELDDRVERLVRLLKPRVG
jgi:DNA-binding NarL/FixJ family response regulator